MSVSTRFGDHAHDYLIGSTDYNFSRSSSGAITDALHLLFFKDKQETILFRLARKLAVYPFQKDRIRPISGSSRCERIGGVRRKAVIVEECEAIFYRRSSLPIIGFGPISSN
jgi:hypothetical protein